MLDSPRGRAPVLARVLTAVLAIVVASSVVAASAQAAVTSSAITAPTAGRILNNAGFSTLAVGGTTTGSGNVDLRCYFGPNPYDYRQLAGGVVATTNFFTQTVSSDALPAGACTLRAVPAGTQPSDLAPFSGPQLTFEWQQLFSTLAGPNGGQLDDFYIANQQGQAFDDFDSVSQCGLCDARLLTDPMHFLNSRYLYFGNGALYNEEPGNARTYAQIDGHAALLAKGAENVNPSAAGLPPLSVSWIVAPGTRDLTISEDEDAVRCGTDSLPLSPAICPTFLPTGVHLHRTIFQTAAGTVVRIVDAWTSTDGAAHTVDLDYDQLFQDSSAGGPPPNYEPSFQFPWVSPNYAVRATGDVIPAPPSQPASIFIKANANAADGDTYYAQGAITADPAPSGVRFYATGANGPREFALNFQRTIPPGGTLTIKQTFSLATTQGATLALAAQAEDQQEPPVVSIASPANGATVNTPVVSVTGTATDSRHLAGLSINGTPTAVGPGGAFAAAVGLGVGANTITATATDGAGNQTSQSVTVTYRPIDFSIVKVSVSRSGVITEILNAQAAGRFSADARNSSATLRAAAARRPPTGRGRRATNRYGSGAATAARPGRVTLRINPSAAATRALNAGRTLRLTITDTFAPAGGGTTVSHALRLTVRGARRH